MAGKDYYATLGVAKKASEDELKKGRPPGTSAPMRFQILLQDWMLRHVSLLLLIHDWPVARSVSQGSDAAPSGASYTPGALGVSQHSPACPGTAHAVPGLSRVR